MNERFSQAEDQLTKLREAQGLLDEYRNLMRSGIGVCSVTHDGLASLVSGDLVVPICVTPDAEIVDGYVTFYADNWQTIALDTGGDLHLRLAVVKTYDGVGPDYDPISDVLVVSKQSQLHFLGLGAMPTAPRQLSIVRTNVAAGELLVLVVTATSPTAPTTRWWSIADNLMVTIHFQGGV